MTIGLSAEEFDPLDSHRRLIQVYLDRAAKCAGIICELMEMKKDAEADILRRSMVADINTANAQFKDLQEGLARQPARDAALTFARMPDGSTS